MPACSQCGIAWTEELVIDCPRCRYRPRGGKAAGLLGYIVFALLGAPVLILPIVYAVFGGYK